MTSKERKALIEKLEKEFIEGKVKAYHSTKDLEKALEKAYKKSAEEIKNQVYDLTARIEMAGKEVTYGEVQKYNRLKNLYENIGEEVKGLGKLEVDLVTEELIDSYVSEFLQTTYQLGQIHNVKIDYSLLKPDFIKEAINYPWSGEMFSVRIWDNKELLVRSIRQEITRGYIQGKPVGRIAQEISKRMGSSFYNAQRVARTENMRVCYVADTKVYQSNGVKKVRYLATEDERTCEECSPHHYKVFDLGDEPMLPQHPHCRCSTSAITMLDDEYGAKTTSITENARDFTYEEWEQVVYSNKLRNGKL